MVCAKEESVCGEDVGRTAEGEERDGRGKGGESGRDESRQRIGFGLFAPWPATLHTVARHEAVQARINRFLVYLFFTFTIKATSKRWLHITTLFARSSDLQRESPSLAW